MSEIVLSMELSMKFDEIVDRLKQKLYPQCIILADISGQLLSFYIGRKDLEVTNLAALFASHLGANGAIADEIKDKGFNTVMQEGDSHNIFISRIDNNYLLAVVFSKKDQMGIVRLFAKKAGEELSKLTREYEKQNPAIVAQKKSGKDFANKFEQVFDEIFETL